MTYRTASLTDRIADGIVELIRDERLAPGDALLSARELAKRFEVTMPTVRESLRRLEATDVIRFRHGAGTFVGDGVGRRVVVNRYAATGELDSALELLDARIVLEPSIAAQAARARTDQQLERLERSAENALRPQVADERPELQFHVILAEASGNRLLRETVEALLQVRVDDQVAIRHWYDDRERDHAEHLGILAAVRDGDGDAAAELTRTHLDSIRTVLADSPAKATAKESS